MPGFLALAFFAGALPTAVVLQPVANMYSRPSADADVVSQAIDNVVARTGRTREEARAYFASQNPQQRVVQPGEVAEAVLWLCGDGAAGVNGAAIPISGGDVG